MDDLAKLITSDLRTCIREYGDMFKLRNIHINVAKGYNEDDPWLVTYNVGAYGDTDKVEGADLGKCVREHMRRRGWTEANKPMVLIEAAPPEQEHGTLVLNIPEDDDTPI